jgi:lipoyl(octanoyl) transferase
MSTFKYIDLERIDYADALTIQTEAFESLLKAKQDHQVDSFCKLYLCEHNPVITIGKSGKEVNLLVSESTLLKQGISFYHVNRGGDITYHGPGQITGYPIFDLERYGLGLKEYVHCLEQIIIDLLAGYGLKAERMDGATGVWLDATDPQRARKLCAIGVKSSRYVTMHGFALNVNTELDAFKLINPCGFTDRGVTSMAQEFGFLLEIETVKSQIAALFAKRFL